MSRLVVVRVGNPEGLWATAIKSGIWSSPECHTQVVRDAYVEGYKVVLLFLGTGDMPLLVATVSNVRERRQNEQVIPLTNELGELKTIIEFNDIQPLPLCQAILPIIRYKIGSQIPISNTDASLLLTYYTNYIAMNRAILYNTTYFVY